MANPNIFIGPGNRATPSKTGGVWSNGTIISHEFRQILTSSPAELDAVIAGWINGLLHRQKPRPPPLRVACRPDGKLSVVYCANRTVAPVTDVTSTPIR